MERNIKLPYIHPSVSRSSEQFPNGLPPLASFLERVQLADGYIDKRTKDVNKRYDKTRFEIAEKFEEFVKRYSQIIKTFDDLLTDYDKDVLSGTGALSILKPSHTDLDAAGTLGRNTDFTYQPETIEAVKRWYGSVFKQVGPSDSSLSLPRGKNLGWPHPISGKQRELADILLALHAALAMGAKTKGWSLEELTKFLESYHGPAYTIYGERGQHPGPEKDMPMGTQEGWLFGHNFEMRVRGIYMVAKYMIAYNRSVVKTVLKTILASPMHIQDRPTIKKRIGDATKAGWQIIALDVSKFDQSFGDQRGTQMLQTISDIWGTDTTMRDFETEFNLPLLLFSRKEAFMARNKPILPSGAGFTTLVGNVGNVASTLEALSHLFGVSPDSLIDNYGKTWDYLAWGDDTILMFKDEQRMDDVMAAYDKVKLGVTEEPIIKYLGSIYGRGLFKGSYVDGYSTGRAIQQQFFPERIKLFPFSVVGYIARLDLMGDNVGKQFHDRMRVLWDRQLMGDYFNYSSRHQVLQSLLPEIEKRSAQISQVDDILQVLVHGIDRDMLDDFEFGEFEDFLGITHMDLDKPSEELESREISPRIVELIGAIEKGDFDSYFQLIQELVINFNLTWKRGGVLY